MVYCIDIYIYTHPMISTTGVGECLGFAAETLAVSDVAGAL